MNILDTILTNTYTIHDLRHRVRILKSHLEDLIFGQIKNELTLEDNQWILALSQDFIKQFNKENLYSTFKDLEKQLESIKPLTIYLAFEPSNEQIEGIGKWLQSNLTKKQIFEIKIDPSLVAGTALVYNGVYKDYSIRSRINQQSSVILEEFKKYIR